MDPKQNNSNPSISNDKSRISIESFCNSGSRGRLRSLYLKSRENFKNHNNHNMHNYNMHHHNSRHNHNCSNSLQIASIFQSSANRFNHILSASNSNNDNMSKNHEDHVESNLNDDSLVNKQNKVNSNINHNRNNHNHNHSYNNTNNRNHTHMTVWIQKTST